MNKFRIKPWLAALCLVGGTLVAAPSWAALPLQLDGNAASEPGGGFDWEDLVTATPTGFVFTGLKTDDPEPQQASFTGGGSKDESDIPNWAWTSGSSPDKDDITHAFATSYTDPDSKDVYLVFGMDRLDNSGSAELGFWFLQDNVTPVGAGRRGGFTGKHLNGDILVLVEFTNGGTEPHLKIYEWNNGTMDAVAGDFTTPADCTAMDVNSPSFKYCGVANKTSTVSPWFYATKGNTTTDVDFPVATFFEGAINLSNLFDKIPCISTYMAESRSSHEINATLKDFVSTGLNTCKIAVTKACLGGTITADPNDPANNTITYDILGKVTNESNGATILYDVELSDVVTAAATFGDFKWYDCSAPNTPLTSTNGKLDELGAEACYKNTITMKIADGGYGASDTISAKANSQDNGAGTVVTAKTDLITCPKPPVSNAMTLSKKCVSSVTAANDKVYAQVTASGQVCNESNTPLAKVQLTDTREGKDYPVFTSPISLPAKNAAGTNCKSYEFVYTPTQALTLGGGSTTSVPSLVYFKDVVKVSSAVNVLNNDISSEIPPAPASCPLCCSGPTCPQQ